MRPNWLQAYRDSLEAASAAMQEQRLAEMTVKTEGLGYWVGNELKLIEELAPKRVTAKFSHSNFPISRDEDHCRLSISFLSVRPRSCYTDFWYRPGDKRIRFKTTLLGRESSLLLGVADERLCSMTEDHPEPMSAEVAARLIAEPMIQHVVAGILVSA